MRGDFDSIRRQFLTAERALRQARGDAIEPLQKVYDEAKRQFEGHKDHPTNKMRRKREAKKRF